MQKSTVLGFNIEKTAKTESFWVVNPKKYATIDSFRLTIRKLCENERFSECVEKCEKRKQSRCSKASIYSDVLNYALISPAFLRHVLDTAGPISS